MFSVSSIVHNTTQTRDFRVQFCCYLHWTIIHVISECKPSQLSLSIDNCPCGLVEQPKRFQPFLNWISFIVETINQSKGSNEVSNEDRKAFQCKPSVQGRLVPSTTNSGTLETRVYGREIS